jgi:DNA invertase Pin-like site-specific DNA recombinase
MNLLRLRILGPVDNHFERMVSEMELGFIKLRQSAGIEAAIERGVYKGRKQNLDCDKVINFRNQA